MKAEELGAWQALLQEELEKPYWRTLSERVDAAYAAAAVYPPREALFVAFRLTPPEAVRAVILGQDPYHEPGQAHGLAFSVQPGVPEPPSLQNIFKELHEDVGFEIPPKGNGCLIPWAKSGVLLLNTALTVRAHQANSHRGKGWEQLTDRVIELLNEREKPIVFILWGSNAKSKVPLITGKQHLIITSVHPSPLSAYRGFFGGKYFSRANEFLEEHGEAPVEWSLSGRNESLEG